MPVVPVLGALSCLYLMLGLPWVTWIRFGLWLVVGLVVYFLYGRRRSKLARLPSGPAPRLIDPARHVATGRVTTAGAASEHRQTG